MNHEQDKSALLSWRHIRLSDELDKYIRMVAHVRQCLEDELLSGLGGKAMGILDKDLRKVKELGASLNSAVDAKVRFDKAQKALQQSMTPDEEFDAVVAYIRSLDTPLRDKMYRRCFRLRDRGGPLAAKDDQDGGALELTPIEPAE